jgi:hypothetical protein
MVTSIVLSRHDQWPAPIGPNRAELGPNRAQLGPNRASRTQFGLS